VILVLGLAKAFESISDVFYGLIQQHEWMDRIAISMMIKGPLSLVLLASGVYLTGGVLLGAVGLALAWAVVLVGYDIRSGLLVLNYSQPSQSAAHRGLRALQPLWRIKTLRNLIWLCLPLGLVMMLISLNTNIPRYFIERYLGERELGIFAAIAYLMVAGNMIVNALGESACPRLAKYYAAQDRVAFCKLIWKLVGIAALLGITAILIALIAGREILTILYQPEYAQHTDLFVWLMVAAAIGYIASFLGYGITAARYFSIQMPQFILVTGTSALACLWLLPKFGLQGTAIALIISASVQIATSLGVIIHALHKLKRIAKAGGSI
jgi:O-antigen/teichoic acid export membrane protein